MTGVDPRLLKTRVKRVRQQEAALATVKRTLVTYITEHAATTCEHELRQVDGVTLAKKCITATDGVLMLSCGHFAFLCAEHGSRTLQTIGHRGSLICTKDDPDLHPVPAIGVTLEWCGL
jgi:hypothetical protein